MCERERACVLPSSLLPLSNLSSSAGDLPKENPYEDVDLKSRRAGRKSQQLSENSLDSLHRMWSPQDRKYSNPPTQVMAAGLAPAGSARGPPWGPVLPRPGLFPFGFSPPQCLAKDVTSGRRELRTQGLWHAEAFGDSRDMLFRASCPTAFLSPLEL